MDYIGCLRRTYGVQTKDKTNLIRQIIQIPRKTCTDSLTINTEYKLRIKSLFHMENKEVDQLAAFPSLSSPLLGQSQLVFENIDDFCNYQEAQI